MKIKAFAKVNLFLEITSKRKDGYHNLKSIFARISLADEIEIKRNNCNEIRLLTINKANFTPIPNKDNLVWKAADAFCREFSIKPAFDIKVVKNIPAGAGLGGGSSDCASTLRAMAGILGLNLRDKKIERKLFSIAAQLGSDVPFFLSNNSMGICSLRGEKIKPIHPLCPMPWILVLWPDVFVSTAEVYKIFKLADPKDIRKNLIRLKEFEKNISQKKAFDFTPFLFNRLESGAFLVSPEVEKMKNFLNSHKGISALMSGSGSAVFALSYDRALLLNLKRKIPSLHKFVFLAKFI